MIGFISLSPEGTIAITGDDGLVPCDGRSLSRETYPQLFGTLGTAFDLDPAAATAAGLFAVPDYRYYMLPPTIASWPQTPQNVTVKWSKKNESLSDG